MRKRVFFGTLVVGAVAGFVAACVGDIAPADGGADTGTPDTGTSDTGNSETGTPDSGTVDTGPSDTGTPCILPDAGKPGTRDTTFQFNNATPPTAANFNPNAVTVAPDGNIYVAGVLNNSNACSASAGKYDIGLYAFTSAGLPNAVINPNNAPVCLHFDDSDSGYSIAVDGKNRVVVGGLSYSGTNGLHAVLARYTVQAGASLDSSFNGTGKVDLLNQVSTMGDVYGIAIDAQYRIYAAGSTGGQGNAQTKGFLVRINENGTLDAGFKITDTGVQGYYGVDVDANGVTVSGAATGGKFVFKRYTLSGQLDASFATNGVATSGAATDYNRGLLRLTAGGWATIGARSPSGNSGAVGVALVQANGQPNAFFNNGEATLGAIKFDLWYNTQGLGELCNGSLLVAGRYDYPDAAQDMALIRFNPNGTQDTTFGAAGLFLSSKTGNDIVVAAAQDPVSKKIILAGRDYNGLLQLYRIHP